MNHPEDLLAQLPPPPPQGYHCLTCAALGHLGTTIDRLEAGMREIASQADNALHGESPPPSIDVCATILGVARDALGEP